MEAPTLCSKDSGPTDFTLPELLPTPTVPLGPLSLGHSLPEEIPGWQEPTLPSGESRTRHVPAQPTDPAPATQRLPACPPGITPPSSSREPRPTAVPGQAPPSRPGLCARVPVASSPGRWTPPSRSRSWPPRALLGALLQAPPEPEPCSLTQVCPLVQRPCRAEHLLPSAPALSWST